MAAFYDDGLEKHATQFIKLLSIWFWTKMVAWATNQIRNLHNNTSLKKKLMRKFKYLKSEKNHMHTLTYTETESYLSQHWNIELTICMFVMCFFHQRYFCTCGPNADNK